MSPPLKKPSPGYADRREGFSSFEEWIPLNGGCMLVSANNESLP